ncbi:sorting nexin-6-like [Ptychodera flava]|uniref:sorting nexin-6-like n=1 Tax=Ptychodera flava TaxID=63121 RepID=UPI00396A308B
METMQDANGDIAGMEPFEPWYTAQVVGATKDGDVIKYELKTKKLDESNKEVNVIREYEDFQWLEHCLVTNNDVSGLILPPLPPKPGVSASGAEAKSKKQLGSGSKALIGDEFHKDCRGLEKYLQLVLKHELLGKEESLGKFLVDKEAPMRTKLKKNILSNLSKAVGEARKGNHKDIDDTFQKERDNCNDKLTLTKEASDNFNKMVYIQLRLEGAYSHLSTMLNLGGGVLEGPSASANNMLVKFSHALDDYKHGITVFSANDENTLGFTLDLYARYQESEKEMLYRRTCKMIDLETATKNLEKAKPQKRDAAEDVKKDAEAAFDKISDVAKKEIVKYHRERVLAFQKALILYAEAKVKTARDTYALLARDLKKLKEMDSGDSAADDPQTSPVVYTPSKPF